MSFLSLTIQQIVIHEVPGRGSPTTDLALSDVPSELNSGQREYIQGRVRGALAQRARPIVEVADQLFPAAAREMLRDPSQLVLQSQAVARLLHLTQPAISPAGIITVSLGAFEGAPALVVAKLEHELGVRAHQTVLADGRKTFDVEVIRDLLFTEQSRVFKVAVFPAPLGDARLQGFMVDNQAASHSVAHYFLTDFLGCEFSERSDVLTEKFQTAAETWINRHPDPGRRGRYEIALLSEIASNSHTLSATNFASRHLDVDDRDDFEEFVRTQGVPPREFSKDVTLVANRLRQLRIDTASGVSVLAPTDAYEDGRVTLESYADGEAVITVRDALSRVSGRGRAPRSASDDPGASEEA